MQALVCVNFFKAKVIFLFFKFCLTRKHQKGEVITSKNGFPC